MSKPIHQWTPDLITAAPMAELVELFGKYIKPNPIRKAKYRAACRDFAKAFQLGHRYHIDQMPTDHKILKSGCEFGFECGGRSFYYPTSVEELPPKRYKAWLVKWEEYRMGITREFLEDLVSRWDESLNPVTREGTNKGSLKLSDNAGLLYELRSRMQVIPQPNLAYMIASVYYFELGDDITDYDPKKEQKKIEFWEETHPNFAFFLRQPTKSLMGLAKYSDTDLETLLRKNLIRLNTLNSRHSPTSKEG